MEIQSRTLGENQAQMVLRTVTVFVLTGVTLLVFDSQGVLAVWECRCSNVGLSDIVVFLGATLLVFDSQGDIAVCDCRALKTLLCVIVGVTPPHVIIVIGVTLLCMCVWVILLCA